MQAKENKFFKLGIYVHVPFCSTACDFCAFYQKQPNRKDVLHFIETLKKEISQLPDNLRVDTIFFGGGTPGLLLAEDLTAIGEALLAKIGNNFTEWTLEMSPSTVKADKIEALKKLGVNRLSMGVQSFDENLLKELGRLHSPRQVYQAYDIMREGGFSNINLDMMFALPGQSDEALLTDLQKVVALNPSHISTYCLTFEEDTPLYIKLSKGKLKINRDRERDLYINTWRFLEEANYKQYEISNFSQNQPCTHNIHTWEMQEWIGIGPSAASQYNMKRFTNPPDLKLWEKRVESNSDEGYIEVEHLNDTTLALDSILFGLRMNSGIDLAALKARFEAIDFSNYEKKFNQLIHEGLMESDKTHFKLTTEGRLLVDQVALELM